ncbi:MAG: KTSC domain-containing protein [Gorillibacterium sp.]|nr:KTSC domain-containing protein [Gorillibacterium sp.]
MYPHQLIGKKALRTKEVVLSTGVVNRSYTNYPITILAVTEQQIFFEVSHSVLPNNIGSVLSCEWMDNNWTSYDELMNMAIPERIELMKAIRGQRMILLPVQSSNIAAVGYDNVENVLHVQFKGNEKVYTYQGVPNEEYNAMMVADSIGSYYAKNIRKKYEAVTVGGEQSE